MKNAEEAIAATVLELIKEYRGRNVTEPPVTLDSRIVKDLGIKYDAGEFVIALQERTGIKAPWEDWGKIETVGEVIQLLLKYAPRTARG